MRVQLEILLHKSDFILLFIEGHDVFLHFDIAKVKTRSLHAVRDKRISREA